jgi:hypothetical protein
MGHVIAEAVGEIRGIHAGIHPAPNTICDSKGNIIALSNSAHKESILSAIGPGPLVFPSRADVVVGVEVEDILVGVIAAVLCSKGGRNAIAKFGA